MRTLRPVVWTLLLVALVALMVGPLPANAQTTKGPSSKSQGPKSAPRSTPSADGARKGSGDAASSGDAAKGLRAAAPKGKASSDADANANEQAAAGDAAALGPL